MKSRSGWAVPLNKEGKPYSNEWKWFNINLSSSKNLLHASDSVPPLLDCDWGEGNGRTVQLSDGSLIHGLKWESANLEFSDYPDVSGEIALGPESAVSGSKLIYLSRDSKEFSIRVLDSEFLFDGVRFDTIQNTYRWAVGGDLEYEIAKHGRYSIVGLSEISFDFYSEDISVPEAAIPDFLRRSSWSVMESRLYVSCEELKTLRNNLMDITTRSFAGDTIGVSVTKHSSLRPRRGKKSKWGKIELDQCATNLVFNTENRVVFGISILAKYDIGLDKPNGWVHFIEKGANRAKLNPIASIEFPTRRFSVSTYVRFSSSDDRSHGVTWDWRESKSDNHFSGFYFKAIPTAADPQGPFEFLCLDTKECLTEMQSLFQHELSDRWTGFPLVSVYRDSVTVTEFRDWQYHQIMMTVEGNLVKVSFVHEGYRAQLQLDKIVDGRKLLFLPAEGSTKRNEFRFKSWPPELRDGKTIDLVPFDESSSGMSEKISRWIGEPIIEIDANNALVIRSDASEDDFVPERSLIVKEDGIVFGSTRRFLYCVTEPNATEKKIEFVYDKEPCEHPVFVPVDDQNLPNLNIKGTEGRFVVELDSPSRSRVFPESLALMKWPSPPVVDFRDSGRTIEIHPSTGGRNLQYDVNVMNREGKLPTLEFTARRPRFLVNDPRMLLNNNRFVFERHSGRSQYGEFMMNLDSDSEDSPIEFKQGADGSLWLELFQVVPFKGWETYYLFKGQRTEKWYGLPSITINSDKDLVIFSANRNDGHVFSVVAEWTSDTDMVLKFVPVAGNDL